MVTHTQNEPRIGEGLACLPAVYILGFAKCGSTHLHYRLTQHPHIHGGEMKELRFWYGSVPWLGWKNFYGSSNETLYTLFSYAKMFDNVTSNIEHQLVISKNGVRKDVLKVIPDLLLDSDITMYRPEAVDGILHLVPNAKAIVIMRDPVEREFSFYRFLHPKNHRYDSRYRFANTPMGFHQYILEELKQKIPFTERRVPFTKTHHQSACYANYIEMILQKLKPNHVLLIHFETYIKNPTFTIESEILPFLSLESTSVSRTYKSSVKNASRSYSMLNITRILLQNFFRPCNEKLVNLLGDNKWRWDY